MFDFSFNNRFLVGSISGLTALGLGYYIYNNYSNYFVCNNHCTDGKCNKPTSETE